MPVYADPVDGLAVPADLLLAWTARLVETLALAMADDLQAGGAAIKRLDAI